MSDAYEFWDSDSSDQESGQESFSNMHFKKPCCLLSYRSYADEKLYNLDDTAILCYIEEMKIKRRALAALPAKERAMQPKGKIETFFKGKRLICCTTAWDLVEEVLNNDSDNDAFIIAEELKKVLCIYPDDFGGKNGYLWENLKLGGPIHEKSKLIFNFGHRMKATTISSTDDFINASLEQGVPFYTSSLQSVL